MQLRKIFVLALALASPSLAASSRPGSGTPSPFGLAPRPVASATGTGSVDLGAAVNTATVLRVGGAVAMLDVEQTLQPVIQRPAGFLAFLEPDEGVAEQGKRNAGRQPHLMKEVAGGNRQVVPATNLSRSTQGSATVVPGPAEIQKEQGGNE